MRKIYYRKYTQPEYSKTEIRLAGTGGYSEFIHEGFFHQWQLIGEALYAIIEVYNGSRYGEIILVQYDNVRF